MAHVRCRMEVEVNVASNHRPITGRGCGPRDVVYDDTESEDSDYDYGDYEDSSKPNDGYVDVYSTSRRGGIFEQLQTGHSTRGGNSRQFHSHPNQRQGKRDSSTIRPPASQYGSQAPSRQPPSVGRAASRHGSQLASQPPRSTISDPPPPYRSSPPSERHRGTFDDHRSTTSKKSRGTAKKPYALTKENLGALDNSHTSTKPNSGAASKAYRSTYSGTRAADNKSHLKDVRSCRSSPKKSMFGRMFAWLGRLGSTGSEKRNKRRN